MGYRTPDIGIHTFDTPVDNLKPRVDDVATSNALIPDDGDLREVGLKPYPAVADPEVTDFGGGGVGFNTPGLPEENAKPIKDMVRTPGKPNSKPLDVPVNTVFHRRRFEGSLYLMQFIKEAAMEGEPYPPGGDHQKKQKGKAKVYHKNYYKKHKSKIKTLANRWYNRHKNKGAKDRDEKRRTHSPQRFVRKPNGYSSNADRAKDQREEAKEKHEAGTIFYWEKLPPTGVIDRAVDRVPDGGKPAEVPYVPYNPHAPGSSRVIPEGHGFVNKQANSFLATLPHQKQSLFFKLIKLPVWKMFQQGRVNEKPIVEWFGENGWKITPGDFHAFVRNIASEGPIKAKLGSFARRALNASTLASIISQTSPAVQARSEPVKVKLVRVDRKNGIWLFNAQGTSLYRVRVKMPDQSGPIEDMDVEMSCNCPFFRWQGPEHWGQQEDYLYGKPVGTASFPIIRDPDHAHGACKHALAVAKMLIDRYNAVRDSKGK